MPSREGALVIGGDYRALGIVRSLGRHGIPVWVLTAEHLVAATSRYAQKRLRWPQDRREQVPYILDLCDRYHLDGWALFPSDDEAAAVLALHHSALAARFRMTTPPWEAMQWSYDKRLTHRIAADLGISQPATFMPANRDEVAGLECNFPVILKPAFKRDINSFTYAKAWRANDRRELLSSYDAACALVDPRVIMIQEFIPGGGDDQFSYAALCVDGHPQVALTAVRRRQYPLDFGRASTFVESVDAPEVVEISQRLLKSIGLTGLVEVEYKRDSRTNSYQLLDINSRVWGWHTLGRKTGIDFPYLVWGLVHGEPIPQIRPRPGVRWIRMLTDVQAVAAAMLRGRLSVLQYLKSFRSPLEFAIFASDDPFPALMDIVFLALLAWKRERHPSNNSSSTDELGINSEYDADRRSNQPPQSGCHSI